MAYYQPESNVRAEWHPDGGATFWLTYQGREWQRDVGPEDPITVIEAAALLRVTRSTVYNWVNSGKLPESESYWEHNGQPVRVIYLPDLRAFAAANGY